MKSKTPNPLFSKVDLSRRDFVKRTCAVGLAAVSALLLIGRSAQPAIPVVVIENINETIGWHSECGSTSHEAGVC